MADLDLPGRTLRPLPLVSLKLPHELSLRVAPSWIFLAGLYNFRYIIVGVFFALHGKDLLSFLTNRSRWVPLALAVAALLINRASTSSILIAGSLAAVEPVLCGIFVMWFMFNPARCQLLRWPVVQWLGACSYSIYLWQQLFTGRPNLYLRWPLSTLPWALPMILLAAAFSYYFIEKPSIRLGHFLSRKVKVV